MAVIHLNTWRHSCFGLILPGSRTDEFKVSASVLCHDWEINVERGAATPLKSDSFTCFTSKWLCRKQLFKCSATDICNNWAWTKCTFMTQSLCLIPLTVWISSTFADLVVSMLYPAGMSSYRPTTAAGARVLQLDDYQWICFDSNDIAVQDSVGVKVSQKVHFQVKAVPQPSCNKHMLKIASVVQPRRTVCLQW